MTNKNPCDNGYCPFDAYDTLDCYEHCGERWADETEPDLYEDLLLEQQEQM